MYRSINEVKKSTYVYNNSVRPIYLRQIMLLRKNFFKHSTKIVSQDKFFSYYLGFMVLVALLYTLSNFHTAKKSNLTNFI